MKHVENKYPNSKNETLRAELLKVWLLTWISFQFCNFAVRLTVYIVCPSILSLDSFQLHKTLAATNIFVETNLILWLTLILGLEQPGPEREHPNL